MDTFCHFFSMIFCWPDIFDSEREILTTRLTTENRESRQEVWQSDRRMWAGLGSHDSGAQHPLAITGILLLIRILFPVHSPNIDIPGTAWSAPTLTRQQTQTDGGCGQNFELDCDLKRKWELPIGKSWRNSLRWVVKVCTLSSLPAALSWWLVSWHPSCCWLDTNTNQIKKGETLNPWVN